MTGSPARPPRVLIIAGSDSGGGAGIQADIKTVTMLGGFAMTAVTALTAQNTRGVSRVMPAPADMVLAQIDVVVEDLGVDVVKIGMIGSADTAEAVAARLEGLQGVPVIFDPVMVATSGSVLADEATVAAFGRLMRVATLVTPNAPELAALSGMAVDDTTQMEAAAHVLAKEHDTAVLAKGGHLEGAQVTDLLVTGAAVTRWQDARINTSSTHGTGCTLASAIATAVGGGQDLVRAIAAARRYLRSAMEAAPGFGAGNGPLGHQAVARP